MDDAAEINFHSLARLAAFVKDVMCNGSSVVDRGNVDEGNNGNAYTAVVFADGE